MNQNYNIKLEVFEGPLDLLLYLVEKDEVDITCIQVSRICEQFIEYLDLMKELNLDIAGEYLIMAATLIRLKARELLPNKEDEENASEDEIVNSQQLIQQLIEYKKYKEASKSLKHMEEEQNGSYYRPSDEKIEWADDYEEQEIEATIFDLLSAFKNVVEKAKKEEAYHNVIKEEVTIDDCIENVLTNLYDKKEIRFEKLFEGYNTKIRIVVNFMAILELIKLGKINIRQEKQFGQIWISQKEVEEETDNPSD